MTKNDELLLAKAHSVAHHLGKMVKAVSSFHDHMVKLHKVHHDDMHAAMQKLHKMVGIESAEQSEYGATGGEPQGTDLEAAGTKNLQNFGSSGSSDVGKTAKTAPAAKTETGGNMTKAEVQTMLDENSQKMETMFNAFAESFLKAMTGGDETAQTAQPIQKAVGVGDRTQIQQPVQQVVNKNDAGPISQQPAAPPLTPDLAKRAIDGDQEAQIAFMKSALPQSDVPSTLVAPLSKIH